MFSALRTRLVAGLARSARTAAITRPALTAALLPRRAFATSQILLLPAAAKPKESAPTKKPAAEKPVAKKPAAKKSATKKPAAKKAARKKKVAKKVVKKAVKKPKKDGPVVVPISNRPPKRSLISGYIVFMGEYLKGRAEAKSTVEKGELFKKASIAWGILSNDERQAYSTRADATRLERTVALRKWFETTPAAMIKEINRRRVVKEQKRLRKPVDPTLPKKPLAIFLRFVVDAFPTTDRNLPPKERIRKVAEEWKALPDADKQKYKDDYQEDKAAYNAKYRSAQ